MYVSEADRGSTTVGNGTRDGLQLCKETHTSVFDPQGRGVRASQGKVVQGLSTAYNVLSLVLCNMGLDILLTVNMEFWGGVSSLQRKSTHYPVFN